MANEQYTESLTLKEMKCIIGENEFGYVFPQGDVSSVDKIEKLLKLAGGKPKECDLADFSQGGKGKARPEYVITFNDDIHTIIVIECKNTAKKHSTDKLNRPSDYAVDGVLYYAKFLKQEYNVIAIAISGTNVDNMKVDTFYWVQGQDTYTKLEKAKDIILEPQNYVELIKGNKLKKAYSLDEIRNTAIDMHNSLREIKVTEAHKPIFIAGILIALNDEDFSKSYSSLTSYKIVMQNIQNAIENVLRESDIKSSRINYIKQVFSTLQDNTKFAEIPLGHSKSITWYIKKGKRLTKSDMIEGNDNFLGAIGSNNGVREKILAEKLWEPNCITVNYNGSVGEAFYQEAPFWASDDVNILYARSFWKMNKYNALFLATVIKGNKYRFSYGRKWTLDKMKDTILKLPSKSDGSPDFEYMEKFIKSLPYSDKI